MPSAQPVPDSFVVGHNVCMDSRWMLCPFPEISRVGVKILEQVFWRNILPRQLILQHLMGLAPIEGFCHGLSRAIDGGHYNWLVVVPVAIGIGEGYTMLFVSRKPKTEPFIVYLLVGRGFFSDRAIDLEGQVLGNPKSVPAERAKRHAIPQGVGEAVGDKEAIAWIAKIGHLYKLGRRR